MDNFPIYITKAEIALEAAEFIAESAAPMCPGGLTIVQRGESVEFRR
jgi:hypothetical protein